MYIWQIARSLSSTALWCFVAELVCLAFEDELKGRIIPQEKRILLYAALLLAVMLMLN